MGSSVSTPVARHRVCLAKSKLGGRRIELTGTWILRDGTLTQRPHIRSVMKCERFVDEQTASLILCKG
jgi:hypothetical protein